MRWTLLAFVVAGCKVVDAPDNLEELMVFGFDNFEDPASDVAAVVALLPLLEENSEELADGYRISTLGQQSLDRAEVDVTIEDEIAGAMGMVSYRHMVDPVVGVAFSKNKDELFDGITEFSVRDLSDPGCFFAHSCDTYTQVVEETAAVVLIGDSRRKYTQTIRWIEHPEVGPIAAIRSLSPDPILFSTDLIRVNQQYGMIYIIPNGSGATRAEAFWVDGTVLGLDVPDSFSVDTAVNRMGSTAENVDAVLDEQ